MELFEQALARVSDFSINSTERDRLARRLEELKDQYRGDSALKLGLIRAGLAKKDMNLTFFALNYFFDLTAITAATAATTSNNSNGLATLTEQKTVALELLTGLPTSTTHFTSAEYRVVAEKVVSAAVSLAKAEWPKRWPELFPQIFSGDAGSTTTTAFTPEEVVCGELSCQTRRLALSLMLLRSMSEEVRVYYDPRLSERRKAEVIAGLKEQGGAVVGHIVAVLKNNTQHLMAPLGVAHRNVFLLCLDALSAYVDWVPLRAVVESEVPLILTQLQAVGWLKQKAADAALLLVNRQLDPNEIEYLQALWFPLCPQFFADIGAAAQTSAQGCAHQQSEGGTMDSRANAAYSHFVRLTEVFCVAGCKLIEALNAEATAKHTAVPDTMGQYLQLLISLFSHPSLEISALAYPPLTSCFRNREKLGGAAGEFFTDSVIASLCSITVAKLNNEHANGYYSRGDESTERAQLSLINNFSSFIYKMNVKKSTQMPYIPACFASYYIYIYFFLERRFFRVFAEKDG